MISLSTFILLSCNKRIDSNLDSLAFYSGEIDIGAPVEIVLYIAHPMIWYRGNYIIAEPMDALEVLSSEKITDTDLFRKYADYCIHLRHTPKNYAAILIGAAKRIDPKRIGDRKSPGGKNVGGIQGGMVIDIYESNRDGETVRTFIMDNDGKNIFYEEGKEGIYYEMPEIFLKQFVLRYTDAKRELLD